MNNIYCETCVFRIHKEKIEILRISIPFCMKHNKELIQIKDCKEYKKGFEF